MANFALIMLAARVLDTEAFGVFSILFAAGGLFSIVATFGQQVSIMRWWNEYTAANDPATLKGVLRFSAATVLVGLRHRRSRLFSLGRLDAHAAARRRRHALHGVAGDRDDVGASGANGDQRRRGRRLRQSARRRCRR